MTTLCNRQHELGRAAAVCGWFSGDTGLDAWERLDPLRARSAARADFDLAGLVGATPADLFGALARVFVLEPAPSANDAVAAFAADVHAVQGVEGVLVEPRRDHMRVWTVLNNHDRAVEDGVFEAEQRAVQASPNASIEFHVLYRHGEALDAVKPAAARPVL